jgi:hypothetical protein
MPKRAALADDARRIIQRPQKPGLGQQQEIDLLLVPQMVPGGHDIDACVKNFSRRIDRDARPAGRIFPIGNDHVDLMRLAQFWQELPHREPARLPDDVADKEKLHGKEINGELSAGK